MLNSDEQAKLLKMVHWDELLAFVREIIQGDSDAWGIMLTNTRGKGSVRLNLFKHLQHSNAPTNCKNFNSRDCLQVRRCQIFHDS
jgi:hypothetical protein